MCNFFFRPLASEYIMSKKLRKSFKVKRKKSFEDNQGLKTYLKHLEIA